MIFQLVSTGALKAQYGPSQKPAFGHDGKSCPVIPLITNLICLAVKAVVKTFKTCPWLIKSASESIQIKMPIPFQVWFGS
jgi:hypothetical protein